MQIFKKKKKKIIKRAGRHFGFFKRAGRHEKGAGRRALQKKPRQNTAKAGFILRMQIYAVYRNTQTILRTWGAFSRSSMPIYAVGIAQMSSINTPTIRVHTCRDLRRSVNAITRVSA